MAKRLTDSEVVAICDAEIDAASGWSSGELATERAQAHDFYLGEPYGDEKEGRSQIRTREVLETIESIMPSLARIFMSEENVVEFEPFGPEDEDAARQESDRVSYCFWKENKGFFNLYTFCKDALLSKTGILKVWLDTADRMEREEYRNLDEQDLTTLLNEEDVEREIVEMELDNERGLYHVVFTTKCKYNKVCIEACTPEEFGVNRDARSPYAQDCDFIYQRSRKSYHELKEEGYSEKFLDSLPSNDEVETEERLARRHLDDEFDILRFGSHKTMRMYWVTECYLRLDRDGDGISELLKVTLATGSDTSSSGARLMDIEEVDAIPFFTAPPVVLTHKFYGLSIADLTMDLQLIKSTLTRQVLDNTYLANNQRTHVNEEVNLDDLLTRRPGGVVRHQGATDPKANMSPEPYSPLPKETFTLMEYLDEQRKDRTGSGDEVPGLDAKSLASVNTGVAAMAYDQSRARLELIARILAEVAFKPMFKYIHELLQKNTEKAEVVKLRGNWVQINPGEWRQRHNMTVKVGVGIASRERRLMALEAVGAKQMELMQAGAMGMLLMPQHIYNTCRDFAEAWGVPSEKYFLDPRQAPPPKPKEPDPQAQALLMTAQAQMTAAQAQKEKNQVEMAKNQTSERIKQLELQSGQQEIRLKIELETLRADLVQLQKEREGAEKQMQSELDAQIKQREQDISVAELRLRDNQEAAKREVDMYKAMLAAGTKLTSDQMGMVGVEAPAGSNGQDVAGKLTSLVEQLAGSVGEIQAKLQEQSEAARSAKDILRDANGLIVSIGERKLVRDESGNATRIE